MSAVLQAREPDSRRYQSTAEPTLLRGFDLLAGAPGGVPKLRALILEFAVQGRLVRQSAFDEPASVLVQRAQAERGLPTGKRSARSIDTSDAYEAPLPGGWCWTSLGEVGHISPRNEAPPETAASFVQMSSVPVAMMERHKAEERLWRDIKSGFTHFAEGDVGLAKITPCFENGKSTVFRDLTNGIGAGTTELHVVRPLGGLLPEYILLFLKSPGFLRNGEAVMTGSAGQKRVPRSYFESTPLPLPPLAEQHRIVARVEELMKLCDALEQSGRLADEQHTRLTSALFDALSASESPHALAENWQRVAEHLDLLLDRPEAIDALERTILALSIQGRLVRQESTDLCVVPNAQVQVGATAEPIAGSEVPFEIPTGWRWIRLGWVAELINGDRGTNYPNRAEYVASGMPFINTGHIEPDGTLSQESMNYLTRKKFDSLRSGKTLPGDLVYCLRGATLGKTAIVEYAEGAIASSLVIIRLNEVVDRKYAYYFLIGPLGRDLIKRFDNGSAQPNLAANSVKRYVMPLPPIAEQRRIVARVEELRSLCASLRQCLTQSQETQSRLADALVAEVA